MKTAADAVNVASMNRDAKSLLETLPHGVVGLTSKEVLQRLALGRNVLVPASTSQRWLRWIGPLRDPMVILLLIAAPTYFAIGERTDGIATLVALIPIVAVGWLLEGHAQRTLDKLRVLIAPLSFVVRDGIFVDVSSEEIVPDDILFLAEGDVVPADCIMIDQSRMIVDESVLTGESLPIEKVHHDNLLAGSTVSSGQGFVRVSVTGEATSYGQMAKLIAQTKPPKTPLQVAIGRLVRVIATGALIFAALVGVVEFVRSDSWTAAVISAVSLLIAAIPEEFSIVYSLYLSLGAWRMSKESALIRTLPGVETLGSVTVICTDKTGTLTQGSLSVNSLVTTNKTDVELLKTAVLACAINSFDPMDRAIMQAAEREGLNVEELQSMELLESWPFDSQSHYTTQEWKTSTGIFLASKGAFETISQITDVDELAIWKSAHDDMAKQGTRVIAVAESKVQQASGNRINDESGMRLVGLIGFSDPIRPEALSAIHDAQTAGIRIVMITGDNPDTAGAIAGQLKLTHLDGSPAHVLLGEHIADVSDEELDHIVQTTDVFARTKPTEKFRLVESFRRQGYVVAMTGDGVNDAAALRAAHIGVAMGQRGTAVAREAATMVLLDDNFATIVSATKNGRRIYDNLTKAFAYLIAVHIPLVSIALLVPLLGQPLLLVPMQLIVLEVLLHPIVSLVFQAEPAEKDVMSRPPRNSNYAMTWKALWRPTVVGVSLSLAIVATYTMVLNWGWSQEAARGLGFVTLLAAQPFMILVTRSGNVRVWNFHSPISREFAIATTFLVLTVLAVLISPLGKLVQVEPFPANGWFFVFASITVSCLWPELTKKKSVS